MLAEAMGGRVGVGGEPGRGNALVVDFLMPGLSGVEVVARLRARDETARMPILLVTGRDGERDRVRGLREGATDYLVKPVAVDELVARVAAQLEIQDSWRELVAGGGADPHEIGRARHAVVAVIERREFRRSSSRSRGSPTARRW